MSKNFLLWKIEGKKLKGTCYIFGTMHAHDSRVLGIGERVKPYITQCQAFASEINQNTLPSSVEMGFMLPQQQTLSQVLPPLAYKKLKEIFPKYTGNELHLFERWQPMLIQNILTESAFLNDSPESLDVHLWQFASSEQKTMLGLETHEEQQHLIQKLSLRWQVKMLCKQMRNMRSMRGKARRVLAQYLAQDLANLHKSAKKTGGKARKWLLYQRNETMVKRFLETAAKQRLFAAVGAGHLLGGKGVLRLLKKAGMKVRPVSI